MLKPLAEAQRDGDRIYAVVLGSAVNSDGRTNGLLITPSQSGQVALLQAACQRENKSRVALRLGVAVEGLVPSGGRVRAVRLASGEELGADVVVVAIGARPSLDWLRGSGLPAPSGGESLDWKVTLVAGGRMNVVRLSKIAGITLHDGDLAMQLDRSHLGAGEQAVDIRNGEPAAGA